MTKMICKRLMILCLSFVICKNIYSQDQLPEGGFEKWTVSTSGSYEEPSGGWWTSLNSLKGLGGPVTVAKTTDAHSGSYAARLETKKWGTFLLPGLLVSGVFINSAPFVLQGHAFQGQPKRFRGYYKYLSIQGDSAAIFAMITRYNAGSKKRDTLAVAKMAVIQSAANYTLFDLPFVYSDSSKAADSIDVVFSSSAAGSDFKGQVGSTLFVDDVMLEYTNGWMEPLMPEVALDIYPNPANQSVLLKMKSDGTLRQIQIYNIEGACIYSSTICSDIIQIETAGFPSGIYLLSITESGNLISTKRFEISR